MIASIPHAFRACTLALVAVAACAKSGDETTRRSDVVAQTSASVVPAASLPGAKAEITQPIPPQATTTPSAPLSPQAARSADAARPADAARIERCSRHGTGKIYRLRGTVRGKPASGDAIRIGDHLRIAISSEDCNGMFVGTAKPADALSLRSTDKSSRSLEGKLDGQGNLTATVRSRGGDLPLSMTGVEETLGSTLRIVRGYGVVVAAEGGDGPDNPVVYRTIDQAQLVLGGVPGMLTLVSAGSTSAHGACDPGALHEFVNEKVTRAQILADATRLVAPGRVEASEIFDATCERGWSDVETVLLVNTAGKREVVTVQARGGDEAVPGEILSREPFPPAPCP
jgi:hypothetical protein